MVGNLENIVGLNFFKVAYFFKSIFLILQLVQTKNSTNERGDFCDIIFWIVWFILLSLKVF